VFVKPEPRAGACDSAAICAACVPACVWQRTDSALRRAYKVRHAVATSAAFLPRTEGTTTMNIHLAIAPLIALLAGILILVQPRLLNYIVAIYLIVIGVLGLVGASGVRIG
jgi:hypothetical protein